ncbi:MAG: hypothetical protein R3C19_27100 [Planctomycetaceae bacterium]
MWDLFVDAVIDTVTDPTDDLRQETGRVFRSAAEHEPLDGGGLIPAMRFVTEQHQQARSRHFGLSAEARSVAS